MKRLVAAALLLLLLVPFVVCVRAQDAAPDLTQNLVLSRSDMGAVSSLRDGKESTYLSVPSGVSLFVQSEQSIFSLSVIFDRLCGEWVLTDLQTGREAVCGKHLFLHEYVDVAELLGAPAKELALTFSGESPAVLAEVSAFGAGILPESVQRWETPCERADLMLVATHSDDDTLYFAGLLPTYTARSLSVQVVYFIQHWDTHDRPHEVLDGLWHMGVRNYPVISDFPDQYSESLSSAKKLMEQQGFSEDDVLRFQVQNLRRFRPLVVVGHDLAGEYGHGQHRYNAESLTKALPLAADQSYDAQSAAEYGVWQPERCYLHLYLDNPVTANFDVPLEAFANKTAFEVSREAFALHRSQQVFSYLKQWISRDKASEIDEYSPCEYGLFYSSDADATPQADFFADVESYEAQAERKAAEEEALLAKAEAAQKAAEEARKEAEGAGKKEETVQELVNIRGELVFWMALSALLLVAFAILLVVFLKSKKRRAASARDGEDEKE